MISFIRKSLIIFGLVFFSSLQLFSQAFPSKTIKHIKNSTVYVQVKHRFPLSDKDAPTSGSGFFISKHGHVVTCYHVIQPILRGYEIYFPAPVINIKITQHSGSEKHKVYPCIVMAVDEKNDLAILKVKKDIETPFLELETKEELIETMPIWVFGYPFGEAFAVIQRGPEITIGKGYVSALRHDDKGILTSIQVDAAINQGNSGGPVIGKNGKVVGVINRALGSSRVNFAVPSHFLKELMGKISLDKTKATVPLTVDSQPEKASVFINWILKDKTPAKKLDTPTGWQTFCISKAGYESWIERLTVDDTRKIDATLSPDKNLIIPPTETLIERAKKAAYPEPDPKLLKLISGPVPEKKVLMKENFDSRERFSKWQQQAGGMDKRTWFLKDGVLNQFESNELLHSICLGNQDWNNYLIKADVKINDEHDDSRAGLIFRDTEDGFYLFRIHRESNKAQLAYHCKRPFGWFILKERVLDIDITDKWYSMVIAGSGSNISCFLDKKCIFEAKAEHSLNGKIGFYSVESKASFDNLQVIALGEESIKGVTEAKKKILSYWFMERFDLKSTWWYQSADNQPAPWYSSVVGCAQMELDDKTRYNELTKYQLDNFAMNVNMSLGKGNEKSILDFYFRKTDQQKFILRFSNLDKKISPLIQQGDETTVIREMAGDIQPGNQKLELIVKGNAILCRKSGRVLLNVRDERLKAVPGRIGFAVSNLRLVLHQLLANSGPLGELPPVIEEKKAPTEKPDKPEKKAAPKTPKKN